MSYIVNSRKMKRESIEINRERDKRWNEKKREEEEKRMKM